MGNNMKTDKTRYWIVVASRDHVENGKRLGVVQTNHGKASALKRMAPRDCIIFYSPKLYFEGKEPLRKFTAVAMVKSGEMYKGQMAGDFEPYRRNVEFLQCVEADIRPLIPKMSFIRKKESWGFVFKFGSFEIPKEDFDKIAKSMKLKWPSIKIHSSH